MKDKLDNLFGQYKPNLCKKSKWMIDSVLTYLHGTDYVENNVTTISGIFF